MQSFANHEKTSQEALAECNFRQFSLWIDDFHKRRVWLYAVIVKEGYALIRGFVQLICYNFSWMKNVCLTYVHTLTIMINRVLFSIALILIIRQTKGSTCVKYFSLNLVNRIWHQQHNLLSLNDILQPRMTPTKTIHLNSE